MKWYHIFVMVLNLGAIVYEAYHDVRKKSSGKAIRHTQSAIFRGIGFSFFAWLTNAQAPGLAVLFAIVLALEYWLFFNLAYNHFDKKDWWYGGSGPFDSILHGEANRWKNLGLKISLFLIFSFIYFDILWRMAA